MENFAVTEIPPFVHEYLTWKFVESSIDVSLYLFLVSILITLILVFASRVWKWAWGQTEPWGVFPALFLIVSIGMAVFHFPLAQIKTCIQIMVAPKVYLVEKASKIIKREVPK